MNIAQFRTMILNPAARQNAGVLLTDQEATWAAADPARLADAYLAWLAAPAATTVSPALAPERTASQNESFGDFTATPGRVSGFVLGIVALFFVTVPFLCLPPSITGIVLSTRAFRRIPPGGRGRTLAGWGVGLTIAATAITTLLMLLAIPGAIQRNFG